ncbi:Plasmid replication initiator protein [Deinococcus phoenicis]|uniref:Plasmid replication initiator protein n=1 Tax=Deinococcus phoenicis TaxID=1476583 RepID=A0A016QQW1_9DEIO|nr:replication initiator protein A [Deinococcus phoenicis]EYB68134.1 Plasmid replication initiator protein [Deinococcus phoenicis]
MAPRARQPKKLPTPPQEIRRIDEANVGRLGLISIQERIPDSYTSWSVEFEVDGRPARLSCDALPKYGGVPHGLDGDIATALIDLYVESGCPADGVLLTTAYQILKRAGLDDSGRYYQNLRQTLYRLRTSTYSASEAWRDHRRRSWTTVTFNYIEALEFTSPDDELGLSRSSMLKIRLAESIVRSIRAQYTKPLDLEFLTSLDRPLTRALYRLLDARRYPPEDPRLPLPAYTVNLITWAEACKIVDQRSNKIRSTLKGAHEELLERGYLSAVEYEGRGQKQQITYTFAGVEGQQVQVEPVPTTPLVGELLESRVSLAVARRLLSEYGEEHVGTRLQKFRRLIASGYKVRSRSALLVDVIRDQEGKYPDEPPLPDLPPKPAVSSEPPGQTLELRPDPATLEERVDAALKTVQFLLRDRLSVSDYARLRLGLIVGQPDAAELGRRALRAKMEGQLSELAAEILDALPPVLPN